MNGEDRETLDEEEIDELARLVF